MCDNIENVRNKNMKKSILLEFIKKHTTDIDKARWISNAKDKTLKANVVADTKNLLIDLTLKNWEAWKEVLKNKIEHVKHKRESFRNEDGEWQPVRYYKELELLSSRWIDEKEVRSFYKDVDNLNLPYRNYIATRYYFIDDFCYQKYEHGKNEFEKAFISYMDRLIRFLELNKNIIVIASTNNKPSEFLNHAGLYARVNAIFVNKVII